MQPNFNLKYLSSMFLDLARYDTTTTKINNYEITITVVKIVVILVACFWKVFVCDITFNLAKRIALISFTISCSFDLLFTHMYCRDSEIIHTQASSVFSFLTGSFCRKTDFSLVKAGTMIRMALTIKSIAELENEQELKE